MPDGVTIEIVGADALLKALRRAPELARQEIERASRQALLGLIDPLTDYPSPPASSSYVRTGDLGRLWTTAEPEITTMATGFEAVIGNARPGAEFVQGDEQAHVHQGRWRTATDIVKDRKAQITRLFEQAADRVAASVTNA